MEPPKISTEAVLVSSDKLPPEVDTPVRGYDFNNGLDYNKLLESYATTGFQATHFDRAVVEINRMIAKREEPLDEEDKVLSADNRERKNCTIFLAYTSNLVSSGVRETIRFLAQHNLIDVIVTSAGGIEEDFIKCMANTYIGDFSRWKGSELRSKGINRIGNLLVPNNNYCDFETWLLPILDSMLKEQTDQGINWTPSKLINRLGKEIDHPDSIYYWCYKNDIPVFCPAITDGSLGDIMYFHSFKNPGLRVDIIEDVRSLNLQAVHAKHSGMIILGGGLIKHHTCNANLMRNGADFSVYINTASEYDGSDAGAAPDEAISWGKIRLNACPVKLVAEVTLVFPLIVAQTFAKAHFQNKSAEQPPIKQ